MGEKEEKKRRRGMEGKKVEEVQKETDLRKFVYIFFKSYLRYKIPI